MFVSQQLMGACLIACRRQILRPPCSVTLSKVQHVAIFHRRSLQTSSALRKQAGPTAKDLEDPRLPAIGAKKDPAEFRPETIQKPQAYPVQAAKGQDPLLNSPEVSNSAQRKADWAIMKEMARYLWPKDNLGTRVRVGLSVGLLIGAKVLNVQIPFYFKSIVDSMNIDFVALGGTAWTVAGSMILACLSHHPRITPMTHT